MARKKTKTISAGPVPEAIPRLIEKRKITLLRPHHRQVHVFGQVGIDDPEVVALAALLQADGQTTPVEITPDNKIICGHRRVAAAKRLGWTEVDVWVRHDLAAQGDWAVNDRFIMDNTSRRQLSKLGMARAYLQHYFSTLSMPADERRRRYGDGELRDLLGARIGMSGRHLDRLFKVAQYAPMPIQQAVDRGEVSLTQALAVADLPDDQRQELEAAINAGEEVKDVIALYVPPNRGRHKTASGALAMLVRNLRSSLHDLAGRVSEARFMSKEDMVVLDEAIQLLTALRAEATDLGDWNKTMSRVATDLAAHNKKQNKKEQADVA